MAASTIQEGIQTYLLAQIPLTNLIGNRLFYMRAEQNTTLPYAVYKTISADNVPHRFGVSGGETVFQFDVYHKDRYVGLTIARLFVTILRRYQGTMGGITVIYVDVTGPRELNVETEDMLFRFIVEARVKVKE